MKDKMMICGAVDTEANTCGKPAVAIIKDMAFSGKGTEFLVCKECLKSFPTKGEKPLYKILSCVEPQPDTCPDCGHPKHLGYCNCKLEKPVQAYWQKELGK